MLSILGFGCMRFPTKSGGIDESLLGKALAGSDRTQVKIATKLPPFMVGKLDQTKKIFATQLSRLQTCYTFARTS